MISHPQIPGILLVFHWFVGGYLCAFSSGQESLVGTMQLSKVVYIVQYLYDMGIIPAGAEYDPVTGADATGYRNESNFSA